MIPTGSPTKLPLTQIEREDLQEAFAVFANDEGVVLKKDLVETLRLLNVDKPTERLPETLSFDDFCKLFVSDTSKKSEMQRVFDMFDADQKGFVNKSDLQRVAKELGETLEGDEMDEMIQRAASKGENKVYLKDFEKIMTQKLFS